MDAMKFEQRLAKNISDVLWWSNFYNYLYHASLFGAAILNTIAAVIIQFKGLHHEDFQRNAASIMSAIAALLGVIAASGAFDKRWRTMRRTLNKLRELEFDLTSENAESEPIKQRYKSIWKEHEIEISGSF